MKKLYLILIPLLVIFIAVLFFLLIECRQTVLNLSGQEIPGESTEYPSNLLEGEVISLNSEEPVILVIEADISKIISDSGKMEKNILIENDTELILHNVSPEEDRVMQLGEIKTGDFVLVVIRGPIRSKVLTQETFTALKITKIMGKK